MNLKASYVLGCKVSVLSLDLLRSFPNAVPKSELFHLQDEVSTLYPPSPSEIKPSPAELANDLLQQLETQCKQGEFYFIVIYKEVQNFV